MKTETKWTTPRGGCKQCEADNNLENRWYSSLKSLCFSGPTSENLKLKLIDLVPKQQQQVIDGVEGEISVDQTLDYEDETTNTTDDEYSNADDKHSNVEKVEHSSVSLEKIAENFKLLEDRVNAKVFELSSEIDKLKSNSACNNDLSQEYMQNLVKENKSLKAENEALKQRCENLVYAMVSLKANVNDLEEEKKSLLMVIKVLLTDADLNQPENKENHNGWQKVKGRAASERRGETLSASKRYTVISNQFEILSDSDIEIKSQEIPHVKGRQKVINKSQGQTNKDNNERQSKESVRPSKAKMPSTVIIGDSMTKHLDRKKPVRRVSTQTFRGATIEDMKHHIRPCLARKPHEITLHVSTN